MAHKLTRTRRNGTKDTWRSTNKGKLYGKAAELLRSTVWELELTDQDTGKREFLRLDTIDRYRADWLAGAYAAA